MTYNQYIYIIRFKEIEKSRSVLPPTQKEVVCMVEQYLLLMINLLFASLILVTIIDIALIIVLVHILGKQN